MAVRVTVYGTADMKQIESAERTLDRLKQTASAASGDFASSMQRMGGSITDAGTKIAGVGRSMTLGLTVPLVGIGAAGVKLSADFQTTMNTLQVNASASETQMASLKDMAIQMGADTVFSAGEAAQAMLELSKGGLQVADIQGGALASTMNLAATEGMDLASAATIVSNSMNTFGIEASDTNRIVDVLAAGAVASTASVESLAAGLKYAGTTAASLNVPVEDTVTVLAAMSNAGVDASTAGTSLNRFLLGLTPTTKKASDAMKDLGLKFTDAKGELLPMDQIIGQLTTKVEGMGTAQRNSALKTMFGVEGMRVANVLLDQGATGYDKLKGSVEQQGVAQDLANARMSGTAGALEQLKGSVETAGLRIGDALAPNVVKAADAIKGLVDKFTSLSPATQSSIATFGMVAAAIGPVTWALGTVVSGVGRTVSAIGSVASTTASAAGGLRNFATGLTNASAGSSAFATPMMRIGGLLRTGAVAVAEFVVQIARQTAALVVAAAQWVAQTAAMIAHKIASAAVAAGTALMTAAQWALNAAMSANPIALVIIGLVALGAAIAIAWNKSETFRNIVTAAWNGIKAATAAAFGAVKTIIGAVWDAIKLWFSLTPVGLIITHWNTIKTKTAEAFAAVKAAVQSGIDKVVDFAKNVGTKVGEVVTWFKGLPGKITDVFKDAGTLLVSAGRAIVQGLWNGVKALWSSFESWFMGKIDALKDLASSILGIGSPSRVFAEIGGFITDGLRIGIEAGASSVGAAVQELTRDVSTTAQVEVSGRYGAVPQLATAVGGRVVTIAPGAVQVTVNGGDAASAKAAVDAAFEQLVRELRAS